MKTISFVALIVTILLTGGCEKNKEIDLKSKFSGEWVELEPCAGDYQYSFKNDSLVINIGDIELDALYSIISHDSLSIKWSNLWLKDVETHHKFLFNADDEMTIFGGKPLKYWTYSQFIDIKITKK